MDLDVKVQTATIAITGTVSGAIRIGGKTSIGIITPAALTGTAFTFQVSDAIAGTYVALLDTEGNTVSITVAASRGYGMSGSDADALSAFSYMKIVSNGAEAAARNIKVITK